MTSAIEGSAPCAPGGLQTPGIVVRPRSLSHLERLGDVILLPVMFALGGMRQDAIQRTHFWHCQRIDATKLDPALTVTVVGGDPAAIGGNRLFPFPLFHAPIFGGWTHYILLQVPDDSGVWHIGWVHREVPAGSRFRSHVQRMPIFGQRVKVLSHSSGFVTEFFALNGEGRQIPLAEAGKGRVGDRRFAGTSLL